MAHNESIGIKGNKPDEGELFWALNRRYKHVRRLGEGGQGIVHLAEDRYLGGRLLVVKILRPKADEAWRSAFKHEFEALAGLKHPRLSEVYDFGTTPDGRVFFTRDYVAGDDLMTATLGMGLTSAVALFVDICRSLKPLHSRGLVHGDLKPGNIICSSDGVARLIDFSFVRSDDEDAKRRGTVPYMAPEVIETKRADLRADLYSLGATLFEIVSGAPPFEGTVADIVKGHLGDARPIPEIKRLTFGGDDSEKARMLQHVIGRLLSRNPDDRLPNVFELAAALTAVCPEAAARDPLPDFPVMSESVGIDREISMVQDALTMRFQPSDLSPLVVVEGQLGTGKSALLRSIKWRAEFDGIPVLETSGSGGLLRPIAELIDQAAYYLEGDEETRRRAEQLLSTLSEPGRTFAHLDVLTKSAGELLVKIAVKSKLLVIVDALEQASEETLTALLGLIAAVERDVPLAVLVSSESSFPWQTHLGRGESVTMPLLNFRQVSDLTESFLGSAEKETVDRILAHTGGNPLFVTTLLADLSSMPEGAAGLERLGPPKQLEAYWRERLLMLSENERTAMEAAAVLGRPASLTEIARTSGLSETVLKKTLDILTLGGRLKHASSGWSVATLPLAEEVIASATKERLVPMHRRAMELETDEARQLAHAAECGFLQRIEERGVQAAAALRKLGALHAAQKLLVAMRRALKGAPPDTALALELGGVYFAEGDFDAAKQCLIPLAEDESPNVKREALIQLGRLYTAEESLDAARKFLTAALDMESSALDKARIQFQLAGIAFKLQDMPSCIAAAEDGLVGAPQMHRVRADLLGMLAKAAIREGRRDDALRFAEEAESDARSLGDMRAVALSWDILAWVYQRSGDLKKATDALERAVALHFEFGDLPHLMRDRLVLGDLKLWLEEWSEALRHYEQAVRLSRAAVNPVMRLNVHNNYGFALIKMGSFDRAQLVLNQTEAEAKSSGHEEQHLWSVFHLAALAAGRGDVDEALRRFADAKQGFSKLMRPAIVCEIELETVACLLKRRQTGDIAEAAGLIEAAAQREREEEGRLFEEQLTLQQGSLLIAEGRMEEGLKKLDALCEKCERPGLYDVAWQAHFAVANGYLSGDSVFMARRRLRQAEEILNRLSQGLSRELRIAFWQDARRAEVRTILNEISSSNQFSSQELFVGTGSELDAEAKALYRVLELNKQLLTETTLDHLLQMILASAIELTGSERGLVLLPPDGEERGILEVRAVLGRETGPCADKEERFSRSIAESVFLDGEPVVTVDAMQDARFNEFLSIHELKLTSVACLPVSYRGCTLGVLYLENRLRRGRFGGKDLRVLAAFADQAAIALSQNRMAAEIRARVEEVEHAKETLEEAYDRRLEDLNLRDQDLKTARDRMERMRRQIESDGDYHGMLGGSKSMQKVFSLVERVKDLNVPVVFVGESGTGKDLLARVMHEQSNLKDAPFVTASCGSVPETLVESMLFGHEKGAFSGADSERMGLLQAADGGTLYLDEIGDMSPRMQIDLLRVLQEGNFSPVGGQRTIRINVRIAASSRIPLDRLVEEGGLRRDLLYRLQVVTVDLPPLRDRKEDLIPLARRIMEREAEKFASMPRAFSKEAAKVMLSHSWPGNVRELEQVIRRVLAVGGGPSPIQPDELFPAESTPPKSAFSRIDPRLHKEMEEEARILSTLESLKWNRSKAAEVLGIPRRTFYRKLEKMGLIKKK